jgi:hypothetical protein
MQFTPYNATVSIGTIIALVILLVVIILSPLVLGQLDGRMALLLGGLALARLL